jgi:glycosyltransferase involved in cell wall biosynthesis
MTDMLVSAIIPVYNAEPYLAEAIKSVLAQTYRPIEIIVVDDGSTDGSAHVAKRFDQVRYQFQPNRGAGAARNRGAGLAQGSFLAFLDADDLWVEDKLARQMMAFEADSNLDMVFGYVRQFHSPELDEEEKKQRKILSEVMPGHHVGTMLIRRDAFFRVGSFRTDLEVGEFIDWHARATEMGLRSQMLPDVVMKRRIHTNNMMQRERGSQTDYVRILKASLDRRRKKTA